MLDAQTLEQASTLHPDGADALRWDVPEAWLQGRATFGGIVLAALVRAMEAAAPSEDRKARGMTATFAGPVMPGPARIEVARLRSGSGLGVVAARLSQGGEDLVEATLALGRARAEDVTAPPPPPVHAVHWRDAPAMPEDMPGSPPFTRQFELRFLPPLPFSGGDVAEAKGWVRARWPGPRRDAALLVALSDVWVPSLFATFHGPRPMATVTYAATLLADPPPGDAPIAVGARTIGLAGGYTAETSELVSEDGRLLCVTHQTRAIIK